MNRWMAGAAGIAAVGVVAGRRRLAEARAAAATEQELAREGPEVLLHGERLRMPVAYHRSTASSRSWAPIRIG